MEFSAKKNHLVLLILYAVSLPFNEPYSKATTVIMLLLAGNWLFHRTVSMRSVSLLLILLFYCLHVVGLVHTDNMAQGIFELDKKIGFLILPIVLSGSAVTREDLDKILLFYGGSIFAASIICLINAVYQYITKGSTEVFYYHALTEVIDMHAIYMAMYVCFTIFIFVSLYSRTTSQKQRKNKFFIVLLLAYFLIFLFLLSARTVIVGFSVILFSGLLFWGYARKKLMIASGIIILLLIAFTILIISNENNRERFKEAINYNSEYGIDKQYGGRSTRELIWNCAGEVIQEKPVFGSGTGDAQDVLQQCYIVNGYHPLTYLPDQMYNAHSQYLQTLVDLGVTGLLVLILMLVVPAFHAIRRRDYLFLAFISLFAIACITESMLELKQGITFFAFFHTLFICVSLRQGTTRQQ